MGFKIIGDAGMLMGETVKNCSVCAVRARVAKAKAEGAGMMEIVFGVGAKCASCERNPGLKGAALKIMEAMGQTPKDNFEPIPEGGPE